MLDAQFRNAGAVQLSQAFANLSAHVDQRCVISTIHQERRADPLVLRPAWTLISASW
jgi:hypothetical protein